MAKRKKLYEHRIGYISTQGDDDTVYVKSPKIKLTKKEACKLATKKRKGTGYKCKKVYRDELMNI